MCCFARRAFGVPFFFEVSPPQRACFPKIGAICFRAAHWLWLFLCNHDSRFLDDFDVYVSRIQLEESITGTVPLLLLSTSISSSTIARIEILNWFRSLIPWKVRTPPLRGGAVPHGSDAICALIPNLAHSLRPKLWNLYLDDGERLPRLGPGW